MRLKDCVEVIVEKEQYAQEGVHKGMQGKICYEERCAGYWLVSFPQCGAKDDIAETSIKEEDLTLLPNGLDARVNERIKEQYDALERETPALKQSGRSMKEMDNVKVMVEKETYAQEGVHKGMYGWICHDKCYSGYWLVNFPQCGEKADIAEISIEEKDMIAVPILYAEVNELDQGTVDALTQEDRAKGIADETISDYLI